MSGTTAIRTAALVTLTALDAAVAGAARLDPADCTRVAADRFTPGAMAERYLDLYQEVLVRSGRTAPV